MATPFLDSPFFHVYFHELWGLAESISKKCLDVFEKCPVPEKDGYIKVDPALHGVIASLLAEAANLKKLLSIPDKPSFKETQEQFSFRVERTKLLNEALGFPQLYETSRAETRNSVEHFDQYLDRASLSLSASDSATSGMALYNMALSSWSVFDKKSIALSSARLPLSRACGFNPPPLNVYLPYISCAYISHISFVTVSDKSSGL